MGRGGGGGGPGEEEAGGGRAVLVPWDFTGYQSIRLTLIILTINMFFFSAKIVMFICFTKFSKNENKIMIIIRNISFPEVYCFYYTFLSSKLVMISS